MAGILDWFNAPENQGLLALSAGLLQAGGPSPTPVGTGQAIGSSSLAGLQAANAARTSQANQAMLGLHTALYGAQAAKTAAEAERMQRINAALARAFPKGGGVPAASQPSLEPAPVPTAPGAPSVLANSGPTPPWLQGMLSGSGAPAAAPTAPAPFGTNAQAPDARMRAAGQAMLEAGALDEGNKLLEAANKLNDENFTLHPMNGPNGPMLALVGNKGTMRPVSGGYRPGSTIPEGFRVGPNGDLVVDNEWLRVKGLLARAGKPEVSVKVDTGLADNIKDIVGSSYQGAKSAVKTMDAVNRVTAAVQSGNINLGPGADLKQTWDQVASVLGATGKDREERLANTRSAIQGLANFGLQSRQLLQGQGAISDFESRLLEKAAGGDINKLTATELKTLLDVTARAAQASYGEHQRILGVMKANPRHQELIPYYQVPTLPAYNQGAPKNERPPLSSFGKPNG